MKKITDKEFEEIIDEFLKWNPLHNDLDAYLYNLGLYAKGEIEKRPDPKDFGLDKVTFKEE